MASQQRRRLPQPDADGYTNRDRDRYGYCYAG
jgi:hypothetical protein